MVMGLIPEIHGMSLLGKRKEQQDSYGFRLYEDRGFAVVCDGMGGLCDGRRASQGVVETLLSLYQNKLPTQSFPEFFHESLDYMDEYVYRLNCGKPGNRSGTTVIAVAIEAGKLYWFSVGDSRIYFLRKGDLLCATKDHNYKYLLTHLKQKGAISSEYYDQEVLRRGSALISYVGMKGEHLIDSNPSPFLLESGDMILLVSDGIYRTISEDEMKEIADCSNSAAEVMEQICSAVTQKQYPNQDNATIVAIQIRKEQS